MEAPPAVVLRKETKEKKKKKDKKEKKENRKSRAKTWILPSILHNKLKQSGDNMLGVVDVKELKRPELRKKFLESVEDVNVLGINLLPVEILLHIFGFLTTEDFKPLLLVCAVWRILMNEIAMRVFKRIYGSVNPSLYHTNWANLLNESDKALARIRFPNPTNRRRQKVNKHLTTCRWAAQRGHELLLQKTLVDPQPAGEEAVQAIEFLRLAVQALKGGHIQILTVLSQYAVPPAFVVLGAIATNRPEIFHKFIPSGLNWTDIDPVSPSFVDAFRTGFQPAKNITACALTLLPANSHAMLEVLAATITSDYLHRHRVLITNWVTNELSPKSDVKSLLLLKGKLWLEPANMNVIQFKSTEFVDAMLEACDDAHLQRNLLLERMLPVNGNLAVHLIKERGLRCPSMLHICLASPILVANITSPCLREINHNLAQLARNTTAVHELMKRANTPQFVEEWLSWMEKQMPFEQLVALNDAAANTPLNTLAQSRLLPQLWEAALATNTNLWRFVQASKGVVNRPNNAQKTPLRWALVNNSKHLLDILLQMGADPAAIQGPVEDLLLSSPTAPLCSSTTHSSTNEPMFQRLHRLGIKCDTFRNGNTILHMLCKCTPCSYCFHTALSMFSGHVNSRNSDGNTPMHQLLLLSGDRDRIIDLLRAGARTDIKNNVGQTAREMAMGRPTESLFTKGPDWVPSNSSGCVIS